MNNSNYNYTLLYPPYMSTSTDTGFSHVSVKELKDEFKKRKAKGFSNINKPELIKQLQEISKLENMDSHKEETI